MTQHLLTVEANPASLLNQLRLDRPGNGRDSGAKSRSWVVATALAAALVAAGVGAVYWQSHQAITVSVAVAVPPAPSQGSTSILQATGYVTARRLATVSAQITGTINKVLIEEGERVQAGQVLAQLDDTSQQAALAQSQAQERAAEALLDQYEAQLEQAQRDMKRNQSLAGTAIAMQEVEASSTQVRTLTAQLASQRRQVELAHAAAKGAQVQLAYTTIRAPFAGVITAKAAQAGEIVSPMSAGGGFTRTGIGTIVDMDSLEIEVDVNEAYLHNVQPGQPAKAVLDAYPDWNIPAHVIAIIPTADRSKATVKVRVALDQKDPRILPDMGVRVSFERPGSGGAAAAAPKGMLVPASAIAQRSGRSVVFTVDADQAHELGVTASQSVGDLRLVDNLTPGQRVVRTPPADLNDGARVAVKQ